MKAAWFKKSGLYVLAGLVGLGLCALVLYIAQYRTVAPNESTLFYRQSMWMLTALILFLLSVSVLVRGVWWAVRERRAGRPEK